MNAIKMLVKQHRQMEEALDAVSKAEGKARATLFNQAADALMSHVMVEETHFYPAVNAHRTEGILLESLEEHLSLKRILADLIALPPDDARFEPKFHVLQEQAEHHHEEEEEKLFPKVAKLLTPDELEELGETMQAAQEKLLADDTRELAPRQTQAAAELK